MSTDAPIHCSFCGKRQDEVMALVAGPAAHICGECTDLCVLIFAEKRGLTIRTRRDADMLADIRENGT